MISVEESRFWNRYFDAVEFLERRSGDRLVGGSHPSGIKIQQFMVVSVQTVVTLTHVSMVAAETFHTNNFTVIIKAVATEVIVEAVSDLHIKTNANVQLKRDQK